MKKREQGKKKPFWQKLLSFVLVTLIAGSALLGGIVAKTAFDLDKDEDFALMESMRGSRTSTFYYPQNRERETLTEENYIPCEFDIMYGNENLVWVEFEDIPKELRDAFVAIEDKRFFTHDGVDWKRTALAAFNYLFRFRPSFGGSTITQQLVKNVHGAKEYSPLRKLREIIRAIRLEQSYSKEEILTYYLNIVPLGNQCVGVRSAARFYFNKEPKELTLYECAAIAAITNAPSLYEPIAHLDRNTERRNRILQAMKEEGYITEEEWETALRSITVLSVNDPVFTGKRHHNWYVETVLSDVIDGLSQKLDISRQVAAAMVYRGGLHIYTLMDPTVQQTMEEHLVNRDAILTEDGKEIEGAMVITHPQTGDMLGVVGGMGSKEGSRLFNRATDGYYPPGSAVKPLSVYAPGIEWGEVHWGSSFLDMPGVVNGNPWPHNSPSVYLGQIPLHEALAKSKNTVAVNLLGKLGKERVYRLLKEELGFSELHKQNSNSLTDYAPAPLALGQFTKGATPREMAEAFSTFAGGGVYHTARSYLAVYNDKGECLLRNPAKSHRVWSSQTAYIMTKMMEEVVDRGTAHTVCLNEIVDTAGKTGTSGSDKDKWFVGYTPYYVATFHVGIDDGTPLPQGCRLHLSLWDDVMGDLHRQIASEREPLKTFANPGGVLYLEYCQDSGLIPKEECKGELRGNRTEMGYFTEDNRPLDICRDHVTAHYSPKKDIYERGDGDEGDIPFSVYDPPAVVPPVGVTLQDRQYTLQHLIEEKEKQKEALPKEREVPWHP